MLLEVVAFSSTPHFSIGTTPLDGELERSDNGNFGNDAARSLGCRVRPSPQSCMRDASGNSGIVRTPMLEGAAIRNVRLTKYLPFSGVPGVLEIEHLLGPDDWSGLVGR
jgi:hypothetical protein